MIIKRYGIWSLLLASLTSLTFAITPPDTAPSLETFNNGGGSILPVFWQNGKKMVVLTREAYGKAKKNYDDSGGKADPIKQDDGTIIRWETPLETCAREGLEELMAEKTMGFSLNRMRHHIDTTNKFTEHVIVLDNSKANRKGYVVYITKFRLRTINQLKNSFYNARQYYIKKQEWHYTEKDRLAFVSWDDLKKTILDNPESNTLTMTADVVDPQTNNLVSETIQLRPFLVIKLRPFFSDAPYTQGCDCKARFYPYPKLK